MACRGWKLGYGQIESQGAAGFTLTDSDGTRHEMSKANASNPNETIYQSTDGTFILYDSVSHILTYTDGTRVEYGASGVSGKRSYPIKITDRNGNYLLVSYRNGTGPQIATVKDTLARYVRFNYDASARLVTITAPHYAGGADRQVARFYYQDITVSKGFATNLNMTAPDTTSVIRQIYFPGTQNGYSFDYSAYGMIYQIAQLRGMTVDSTSLTTTGAATGEGREAASTLYNYPTAAANLSLLPLAILVDIFLYATNGTWLFPYNRSAAKRMSDVTDVWYIAGLALFYFVGGSLIGFAWWTLHRIEVRKAQTQQAGLNQETQGDS